MIDTVQINLNILGEHVNNKLELKIQYLMIGLSLYTIVLQ